MGKEKITYHSFTEDDIHYMQCKRCFEYTKTSEDSVAITCGRCTTVINNRMALDERICGQRR